VVVVIVAVVLNVVAVHVVVLRVVAPHVVVVVAEIASNAHSSITCTTTTCTTIITTTNTQLSYNNQSVTYAAERTLVSPSGVTLMVYMSNACNAYSTSLM